MDLAIGLGLAEGGEAWSGYGRPRQVHLAQAGPGGQHRNGVIADAAAALQLQDFQLRESFQLFQPAGRHVHGVDRGVSHRLLPDPHLRAAQAQLAQALQTENSGQALLGHADRPEVRIGALPAAEIEEGQTGNLPERLHPHVAQLIAAHGQLFEVRQRGQPLNAHVGYLGIANV